MVYNSFIDYSFLGFYLFIGLTLGRVYFKIDNILPYGHSKLLEMVKVDLSKNTRKKPKRSWMRDSLLNYTPIFSIGFLML